MELGLGTVQFGSAYGISNTRGQVPESEVRGLLELAATAGVRVLDTAHAYGESEAVLGRALSEGHPFLIVTKTAPIASAATATIGAADVERTRAALERSLERLRVPAVYGLLVHHAAELARAGGDAIAELLRGLKARGVVSKIGFSCSTLAELEAASAVLVPDIIQVPCNVLDRRFTESAKCAALRSRGTEVHARSLFLQGLLLVPTARLPARFAPHRAAFERLDRYAARHGLSRIELALGFAAQCPQIDVALVGVTRAEDLREILHAMRDARHEGLDYAGLVYPDARLLNPALWDAPDTHATLNAMP